MFCAEFAVVVAVVDVAAAVVMVLRCCHGKHSKSSS